MLTFTACQRDMWENTVQGNWTLQQWLSVFRTIQSSEVWQTHGAWIEAHSPTFGPGIRERFDAASKVTKDAVQEAKAEQQRYCIPAETYASDH